MKQPPVSFLLAGAVALASAIPASAQSLNSIDLGAADALSWSVLSLGGSTVTLNNESYIQDLDPGGGLFDGRNLGIQGSGKLQMSGNGSIAGSVLMGSGSTIGITSGNTVSGGIFGSNLSGDPKNVPLYAVSQDSLLDQAASDAFSFSSQYAALAGTSSITSVTGTQLFTASVGQNVLNLSALKLGGGEVFTIDGGGLDSSVIVNIFGDLTLNSGRIELVGGLSFDEVLFNVVGGKVAFSGGGNASYLEGTVLALDGEIAISPGFVEGTLIGNKITLTSGADLGAVVPEPSTTAFLAAAFMTVLLRSRRRRD